jgi:hypothetical protein
MLYGQSVERNMKRMIPKGFDRYIVRLHLRF